MIVCDVCKKPSSADARVMQFELYANSDFQLTSQLCPACRVIAKNAIKTAAVSALTGLIAATPMPTATAGAAK